MGKGKIDNLNPFVKSCLASLFHATHSSTSSLQFFTTSIVFYPRSENIITRNSIFFSQISEKLEIVLLHLEAGKSLSWLARRYGVSKDTLSNWVRKYKEAGVEGTRGKSSLDEV